MKKIKTLSLAALLLAGVATSALAQDNEGRRGGRGGWRHEGGAQAQGQAQSQPAAAQPAAQPREWRRERPQTPQEAGGRFGAGAGGSVEREARREQRAQAVEPRGDGERRRDRDGGGWNRTDRNDGVRNDGVRNDGDRNRGDGQGRDWNGRDGRDGRSGWNRSDDGRRDTGRWEQRRYPNIYRSQQRYRGHAWRAPPGFYVRSWSYGEVLPSSWYAQDYRILDWWSYDLPEPPPGYYWVRVSDDALLVDRFRGEIVQVVRHVFW